MTLALRQTNELMKAELDRSVMASQMLGPFSSLTIQGIPSPLDFPPAKSFR